MLSLRVFLRIVILPPLCFCALLEYSETATHLKQPLLSYGKANRFSFHRFRQSKIQNRKSKIGSLDHSIRLHQKVRRNLEPQALGCLEVDHQLELRRPFYREIRGLGSLEDLIDVDCRASVHISQIGSITHEATELRKSFLIVDGR